MNLGTEDLPGVVVDAAWLAAHHERVVMADARWYLDGRSGRAAYEAGHVPCAVFVDLDAALSARGDPRDGRHPLPAPRAFAEALGAVGIGDDTSVVAYDDAGGAVAGRLVWMLRAQGTPAALLDGGLRSFTGPLETGPGAPRSPVARAARAWPEALVAAADQVATPGDATVVLDARSPERYRGDVEPVDPRAGHIPGARNLPVGRVLDPATLRLADPTALRQRFAEAGVTETSDVIASCGSGVSACILLIALEHAGLGRGRLFVPSFSGWSSDPERPVAAGDAP